MNSRSKLNWIFGVLSAYVIIQFLWWAYLLMSLNADYYQLKQELHLAWGVEGEVDLASELTQKRYMIAGEGLIFLILLIVGIVLTARYMKRDARIARLQHNFLLSVTHELKTPVASAQLYLQTLQKRTLNEDKKAEIVDKALRSNQRLEQLVEKLLLATQLENAGVEIEPVNVQLKPIIARCIETVGVIDAGNHHFNVECSEETEVWGDELGVETMLLNLIENAVKYSPIQSEVYVKVATRGAEILITITNQGMIAPHDQAQVFRKFFRSGNEETRSAKGTGVGLYLVKELAELHRGSIELSVESGIVQFILGLPKSQS